MDMDNPFLWSRSSVLPTAFRGVPVYSPEAQVQQPVKTSSSNTPKVVQIPVHFVGSKSSRSASALKIQKVFRGFLVRKSMKKIIAIRRDVEEMEWRISLSEPLELIRRDERERLRMNEMLMTLLFKLDSVRGVDSGVRYCRRAVIKKAIALQEKIDAIVSAANQIETQILDELKYNGQQNAEGVDQTLEESTGSAGERSGNQIEESAAVNFDHGPRESSEGKDAGQIELPQTLGGELDVNAEAMEFGGDSELKVEEGKSQVVDTLSGLKENLDLSECIEESMETLTEGSEVSQKEDEEKGIRRDDNKKNQELLERMMEDNEKMMKLMSQLYEKNEMQTRMLNTLTQRVEQLEKAFVCHRLKKKKGRHSP